jgi:hypothetical protein
MTSRLLVAWVSQKEMLVIGLNFSGQVSRSRYDQGGVRY